MEAGGSGARFPGAKRTVTLPVSAPVAALSPDPVTSPSSIVRTVITALPAISAATAPKPAPPGGTVCTPAGTVTAAWLLPKVTPTDA